MEANILEQSAVPRDGQAGVSAASSTVKPPCRVSALVPADPMAGLAARQATAMVHLRRFYPVASRAAGSFPEGYAFLGLLNLEEPADGRTLENPNTRPTIQAFLKHLTDSAYWDADAPEPTRALTTQVLESALAHLHDKYHLHAVRAVICHSWALKIEYQTMQLYRSPLEELELHNLYLARDSLQIIGNNWALCTSELEAIKSSKLFTDQQRLTLTKRMHQMTEDARKYSKNTSLWSLIRRQGPLNELPDSLGQRRMVRDAMLAPLGQALALEQGAASKQMQKGDVPSLQVAYMKRHEVAVAMERVTKALATEGAARELVRLQVLWCVFCKICGETSLRN